MTDNTEVSTESPIAEYRPTEAALADLRQRYATAVFDVRKPSGMVEAKAARAELRKLRVALEAERKTIKAPALERCRQIDDEAKRITAELVSLEDPIDDQIKAEESRKEEERRQREEAERKRIAEIQERIAAFGADAGKVIGQPAVVIKARIDRLVAVEIGVADFDEFVDQALEARTAALAAMEEQLERQQEHEAEQERIRQERAELEQLRREQQVRQAAEEVAAAERRRAEDEAAAAERQRLADEARAQREQEEAERAERQRLEQEQRDREESERQERQRAEDAQRAAEQAEHDEQARIAREAEEGRLRAEREELRRQGEAQAAERRRLEAEALANVTLHDAAVSASEFLHAQGFADAQPTRMLDAALSREAVEA